MLQKLAGLLAGVILAEEMSWTMRKTSRPRLVGTKWPRFLLQNSFIWIVWRPTEGDCHLSVTFHLESPPKKLKKWRRVIVPHARRPKRGRDELGVPPISSNHLLSTQNIAKYFPRVNFPVLAIITSSVFAKPHCAVQCPSQYNVSPVPTSCPPIGFP